MNFCKKTAGKGYKTLAYIPCLNRRKERKKKKVEDISCSTVLIFFQLSRRKKKTLDKIVNIEKIQTVVKTSEQLSNYKDVVINI